MDYIKEMEELQREQSNLAEEVLSALSNAEQTDKFFAFVSGISAQIRLLSVWASTDGKRMKESCRNRHEFFANGYKQAMQDLDEFFIKSPK